MNEEKIKELFSDEAFVDSILEMETPEEVQKALSDKGVELSLEEIGTIKDTLASSDGELSENELEEVAGGVVITATTVICAAIIGSAAIGGTVSLGKAVNTWTRRRW
jgi:lactobin A/cerein 7B family class IIb bacteriocin